MKLSELKLDYPTIDRTIAQPFGANANSSYSRDGLLGHPAIDFSSVYNAPIYSASRGLGTVYKIFNKDNPDLSRYRAPCELIELEDCVIEITYGHCDKIICPLGKVTPKQQLATVGNTGDVFSGSHEVTEAEKEAGSTAGCHLHFQLRKCQKVLKYNLAPGEKKAYLLDQDGQMFFNGGYYEYPLDGYNGCIDPIYFLEDTTPVDQAEAIVQNIMASDTTPQQKISWLQIVSEFITKFFGA